jgi:phage gp16-like protein
MENEVKELYKAEGNLDREKDKEKRAQIRKRRQEIIAQYRKAHIEAFGFSPREWKLRINLRRLLRAAGINTNKIKTERKAIAFVKKKLITMIKKRLIPKVRESGALTLDVAHKAFGANVERTKQRAEAKALAMIEKMQNKLGIPLTEEQKNKIREKVYKKFGL